MRKIAVGLIGALAFALNPAFLGCDAGIHYTFGAKEMTATVAGTWKLTTKTGTTHTFTLAQKKANVQSRAGTPLFREAAACSQRTLVASASACVDSTDMPLHVAFLDSSDHVAKATLSVHGATFHEALLFLEIDDIHVAAVITPEGALARPLSDVELVHTR